MPKIRYGATQRRQRYLTRGPLRPRYQPRQIVLASTRQMPVPRPMPLFTRNIRSEGLLDREVKNFDTTFAAAFIDTTTWVGSEKETSTYGLFCPVVGNTSTTRIGRKCMIKSLHLKGAIYKAQASDQVDVDDPVQVTFMIVQDTQTNGAQAQGETVMDTTPAAAEECMSFRNLEYSKRFRLLFKKTFILRDAVAFTDGANTASTTGTAVFLNINKRLNIPVEFISSTPAVADIVDNSIHVYCCASIGNATKLKYNTRIRFVG